MPFPVAKHRRPVRRALPLAEAVAAVVMLLLVAVAAPARADAPRLDGVLDAVLTVHSAGDDDRFLGSAFLWGAEDGVAVTNAHVVGTADDVRLIDRHGNEEIGRVIARDEVRDVAVISVMPGRAGLSAGPVPALGAEVWALGAPLGIEFTVTKGMISAHARQVDEAAPIRFLQHDAAVNPGSSGGPLVDDQGRVVGMNSQIADGSRHYIGIAYAIASDDLARIVSGLIGETLPAIPTLGLTLRPLDRRLAAALGTGEGGLLVDAVAADGLAGLAGVRAGDVLLALAGQTLHRPGDLAFAIEAAQAQADSADLAILRGGNAMILSLSLATPEGSGVLALRDLSGARPVKVAAYSLEMLGIGLGTDGRIAELADQSPALDAGLARGDRILAVNGVPADAALLAGLQITEPALFLLQAAGGMTRHVLLDPWSESAGVRPVGGANVLDPAVVVF